MDDRQLLAKLAAGRLSGDALARELGQTRAAIWKRIQGLRAAGVDIEGRAGEGYGLTRPVELLDPATIRAALPATPVCSNNSPSAGLIVHTESLSEVTDRLCHMVNTVR